MIYWRKKNKLIYYNDNIWKFCRKGKNARKFLVDEFFKEIKVFSLVELIDKTSRKFLKDKRKK